MYDRNPSKLVLCIGVILASVSVLAQAGDWQILCHAIDNQDLQKINTLVPDRCHINMQNNNNQETMLHRAARNNCMTITQWFLARDADPNIFDQFEEGPLHAAMRNSNAEMVRMLLDRGAHPNAPNIDGTTPLHIGTYAGDESSMRMLVRANVNLNTPDVDGITPLHLASKRCRAGVIALLLRNGADPNVKNGVYDAPIFYALARDLSKSVMSFIAYGMDMGAKNKHNETMYDVARRKHNFDLMRVFERVAFMNTCAREHGFDNSARGLMRDGAQLYVVFDHAHHSQKQVILFRFPRVMYHCVRNKGIFEDIVSAYTVSDKWLVYAIRYQHWHELHILLRHAQKRRRLHDIPERDGNDVLSIVVQDNQAHMLTFLLTVLHPRFVNRVHPVACAVAQKYDRKQCGAVLKRYREVQNILQGAKRQDESNVGYAGILSCLPRKPRQQALGYLPPELLHEILQYVMVAEFCKNV
jgi:ankyrin repeat protein